MNCLVTAIGSYAGEAVISSLKKNHVAKVIGCDLYPYSWIPVSSLVDSFYQMPIVYDNDLYLNKLIEIIQKEKINFIIPLTDPEVDLLSSNRFALEKYDLTLCIPSEQTINISRSKICFYNYFLNDPNVDLIPTYEPIKFPKSSYDLPVIAKPENGRSSEGLFIIETAEEFSLYQKKLKGYVFQPFIKGDLFTVDLIRNDFTKKCFAISRKEMIRTKNGAGLTVEVSFNKSLVTVSEYIGDKLMLNGCINIEFIFQGGKYYVLDINPRFSAGISFSILSGYDFVMNHLNCFTGNEIQDPVTYKPMIIARKLTDIITQQ